MINVTVINLKNLIKIIIKIIIVTLIVAMIFELFKVIKSIEVVTNIKEKISQIQVELIQSSTSIFESQTIEKGTTATAPSSPEKEGYVYWDVQFQGMYELPHVIQL